MLVASGCLGFIAAPSVGVWFAARIVMGLGSGGPWMGITFATLEHWPAQTYPFMSRIFAAYSVGGLVGPTLGALGGVAASASASATPARSACSSPPWAPSES